MRGGREKEEGRGGGKGEEEGEGGEGEGEGERKGGGRWKRGCIYSIWKDGGKNQPRPMMSKLRL